MPDHDADRAGLVTLSQDVRAALKRLDPTQSRVLRLVYFERRTSAEVASELGLAPTAVARALAGGMQALALAVLATAAE